MTDYSHRVVKNGHTLFTGSQAECYVFIHKNQNQSVHYAMKHGGYKIVPETNAQEFEKGEQNENKTD